jgi:hypothetical protein
LLGFRCPRKTADTPANDDPSHAPASNRPGGELTTPDQAGWGSDPGIVLSRAILDLAGLLTILDLSPILTS